MTLVAIAFAAMLGGFLAAELYSFRKAYREDERTKGINPEATLLVMWKHVACVYARSTGKGCVVRLVNRDTITIPNKTVPEMAAMFAEGSQAFTVTEAFAVRDPSVVAQGPRPSGAGEGQRDPDGGE